VVRAMTAPRPSSTLSPARTTSSVEAVPPLATLFLRPLVPGVANAVTKVIPLLKGKRQAHRNGVRCRHYVPSPKGHHVRGDLRLHQEARDLRSEVCDEPLVSCVD
jgi:hypothetical protein